MNMIFKFLILATFLMPNIGRADFPLESGVYVGEWSKTGTTYRYSFEVHLDLKSNISSYILWSLKETPNQKEKRKIGLTGKEYVRGTFDSTNKKIYLTGYRKDDPNHILGLDEYDLDISKDGSVITGSTKGGGNWAGKISAYLKETEKQKSKRLADIKTRQENSSKVIKKIKNAKSPKDLYLLGYKNEKKNPSLSKEAYTAIIDRFPDSDLSIKAIDRLDRLDSSLSISGTTPDISNGKYKKFDCVQWTVQWSTNPIFKSADIVKYSINGNVIDGSGGNYEVKIKSQNRTSFTVDSAPYRNGETIMIEEGSLSFCD